MKSKILHTLYLIVTSRNVWIASALMLLYFTAVVFSDYYVLNTIIQALIMAAAAAVVIAYGPLAWGALLSNRMSRQRQLILGIVVSWLGAFLRSAAVVWWRIQHGESVLQSDFVTFCNWLIFLGALLHITAPNVLESGRVPPRGWALLGGVLGFGFMLAWVLVAWQL